MKIRKAKKADAWDIAVVQVDTWRTTYKGIIPDDYLAQMSYEKRTETWEKAAKQEGFYVAENDAREIVGFSIGGKAFSETYANYVGELYAIYILRAYQGKGIGKLLTERVVQHLLNENIQSMQVHVLADNPARHFYESLGAKRIDTTIETIAGKDLQSLVYGWDDITRLLL